MKYLDKSSDILGLKKDVLNILKENNVDCIRDLYVLKRKNLKSFGISDKDICQIIIKLELLGLDLGGKKYWFLLTSFLFL